MPPEADVKRVILAADPDRKDYLWTITLTLARVSEVNALRWDDVNLRDRSTVLYTRKKAGGHMTPRKIPMTAQMFSIMERRFRNRDKTKPWVFWHRYRDRKNGTWAEGPYQDRKKKALPGFQWVASHDRFCLSKGDGSCATSPCTSICLESHRHGRSARLN